MKFYFIILLSLLTTAKAQTYSIAQSSVYWRSQWKTNDSTRYYWKTIDSLKRVVLALQTRLDGKDIRDSWRNSRIDTLARSSDSLKNVLSTSLYYFDPNYFVTDTVRKMVSRMSRTDTILITH